MVLAWFFFFKQKTAYEMRISDWSSDVCSSDLKDRLMPVDLARERRIARRDPHIRLGEHHLHIAEQRGQERSEERRVGKGCVGTCGSRGWRYHKKQDNKTRQPITQD